MTDNTRATLDRLMADVPIGPVPIATLLTDGRAAKRRKRRARIGAAATVTTVAIAGAALAVQAVTGSSEPGVTGEPSPTVPSNGTHLVGIGGAAVAVPAEWEANLASCNKPFRDTYFFPYPQDCVSRSTPTVSSVAITTGAFTETGTRPDELTDDGNIEGHQVVASNAECSPGQGEYCRQVFGIPDLEAYFTVTVPASQDGNGLAAITAIRESLTVLSDDQTIVPFTAYPFGRDNSEAMVVRALQEAGLSVEVVRETCPPDAFCVIGVAEVHPEIGSVVTVGSTVTGTVVGD